MTDNINFKINDSVVVKSNVKDPDLEIDIAGWQGRIVEFIKENNLVCLAWDSITLNDIPDWAIDRCEQEGLDWRQMNLPVTDIETTNPRDSVKDVKKIIKMIEIKYAWNYLGEEGKRIGVVLEGINRYNYTASFKAWNKHLHKVLIFPFDAKVSESQDRGPLLYGDKVSVKGISLLDDLYGIIVEVRFGREKYHFPLCDLTPVDKKSPNYQVVRDYAIWFTNR